MGQRKSDHFYSKRFFPQKVVDNNPMQVHLSGWNIPKMKSLGFNKFKGLAGLNYLRDEIGHDTM